MRQFEAAAGFVRIDLVLNIVSPRGGIVTRHSHRWPASGLRRRSGGYEQRGYLRRANDQTLDAVSGIRPKRAALRQFGASNEAHKETEKRLADAQVRFNTNETAGKKLYDMLVIGYLNSSKPGASDDEN